MQRSQKRFLLLLASIPLLLVLAAVLYMVGMGTLEGESRTFWRSLEFAAETLSTTGYGGDHRWQNPVMVLFVILLQFIGVFLVFLIVPIYLIPVLEERFEARLPKNTPVPEGAVVIYRYGPPVTSLLSELDRAGVPSLVVEPDDDVARRVMARGHRVLYGGLDEGVLGAERLQEARALVANGSDDENAAMILAVRQDGFTGDVLAVVEEPWHRKPMMLAGADAVYTPRHILGAALAARASERISPRVEGAQLLGRKLVVSEVKVGQSSSLTGRTLGEARVGSQYGVSVIGLWVAGRLVTHPAASTRLEPGGILIVAGSDESIHRFSEALSGSMLARRGGPYVLAGYGEVGRKVHQLLTDVGERVVVLDREAGEGVDVVGDVLDYRALEEAKVRESRSVILAVDSDSATLFATVILKEFAADVPVIARVNQAQNVERIHRAGADFALSISQVSGQILAGKLLHQPSIAVDPQIKVQTVTAAGLVGQHAAELGIRERTGASVIAVERDEELLVEFDAKFVFEEDDIVHICGSSEATSAYLRLFPQE